MAERLQWVMTIINTIHNIFDTVGDIQGKMPEAFKQRLPGFLGLSLADEQIFWSVLAQLDKEKQVIISKFLFEKCKDFERNRFINIVAGMEIAPGKPEETEKKMDKDGKVVSEKKTSGTDKIDYRKKFLDDFADIIQNLFGGDLDKAYNFCVGGRMIITDPMYQKIVKFFTESEFFPELPLEERYEGPFSQIKKTFKSIFGH